MGTADSNLAAQEAAKASGLIGPVVGGEGGSKWAAVVASSILTAWFINAPATIIVMTLLNDVIRGDATWGIYQIGQSPHEFILEFEEQYKDQIKEALDNPEA